MADYTELKAAIRAAIFDNTEQAITGESLQDILVEMVDALGVPEGGIPASELTQAVQQALEKALSAYQKPQAGIPASDIASGVIPDVSQFITKAVTDLVHYYTKEETYTQQQVNVLIGAISQFHYEIYASLGDITSPASNVLYLIGPTGSGSDQYEEYVYANGVFTKIGDTSIDLSGYLRYTSQTLTEEEKAQARQNIGAAAEGALTQNDIADNLTTEDPTKVLSAKQGKVLAGQVSQLGQEVGEITIGNIIELDNNAYYPYSIKSGEKYLVTNNSEYQASVYFRINQEAAGQLQLGTLGIGKSVVAEPGSDYNYIYIEYTGGGTRHYSLTIQLEDSLSERIKKEHNEINRKVGFFENTETVVSGVNYTNTIYGDFKAGDVVICELIGDITTLTGTISLRDDSASLVTTRAGMVNVLTLTRDTTYLQLSKSNPNFAGALTFRVHFGDLQDFINEEIGRKAEIYENILSSSQNITKTSSVSDKVIGPNGSPVSATGFSYDCYSISDVTKRYYFKTGITANAIVLVHYYASGSQIGGEVLSATGKTTYAGFLTIPASTDEIRINRNSADASVLYATILYDGSIPDAIKDIPEYNEILSGKTNISKTSSTIDKFLKNDGTLGNAVGFAVDYYDITDADKDYFFATKNGGSGINAVHYFNGETHLGYQYPITSGTTDYSGQLSIPSGTTTIAINRNSGDASSLYYKELYNGSLVDKVLDNSDRITAIEGGLHNIVLLGDSITWLSGVNCTDDRGWGKWFKDKFNPQTIKNYAWSGATWSNTENTVATDTEISSLDDNNTIWQQIRRLIADVNNDLQVTPDVVIIAAGVNDVIGNEAGERPDVFSKTAEQAFSNRNSYITGASVQTITTLADSVRYGCEMLIQAFPNVQIILTTPLQATKGGTPLDKMATARQIIKDCAAFLSANVIEQDKVCGVYYTQEKVGHQNLYDGLHTNATGAKKVGRIIASIVKSMID